MTSTASRRPGTPRIAPIGEAPPELAEVMSKTLLGPSGRPLNIFGTLAHHPSLLKRFNLMGGLFLAKGLLPAREREIVVLRVGWRCQSKYEFGQHTVIGRRSDLSDAEIVALTRDVDLHPWSDGDRRLIALADELCDDDAVSDATWAALAARWSDAEMIELVMLAGFYRMVSGFLNSTGVELDEGVPGFPH